MSTLAIRSAHAAALAALANLAMAQSCPPAVQVQSDAAAVEPGWTAKPALSTHDLRGVGIVEGPLSEVEGNEFLLAPLQRSDGAQAWTFRGPIGGNEVWMRCYYAGTGVVVVRRIDAQTTECVQRVVRDPRTRKLIQATAVCR